ncbi:uncharacterized protein LOC135937691 [Cloeon dipterum]|uniref:uncharacterized protein LOC135937691 n=1 Tax=Cloeon dipterum TaxID=197152 RepID=UPI00321FE33A
MFLVPEVPAAPQNFNPCAPPAPRRVRALYNVEPGRPPALMVGQNRQQMNRPAARPEFQIPPPGFGYIAPIMSENYSFNASRCSWCKLKFGVLTFERLTLQNNRADVCELCLARTQMTMERIFGRIEFDNNRNNNFRNIFDFTETGRVLGYMNDMVQCNHCPKKIPREEIVPHVIDIHNGGAFYKCPRNCENYFRNDQILQHSEQCVRQCIICVANGNLNAPLNLISHIKAEHWQYAICGITGCDGVSTEPDRMFNHMMENHVWRLQHV